MSLPVSPLASILNQSRAALDDPAARAVMRLSFMDWLVCGAAGRDEPVTEIVRGMILDEGGRGQATAFGGHRVPPRAAALVNGTASHALDYDDTHFAHIGHPSAAVIPAALAMGEAAIAPLGTILDAALLGCEASIRFGVLFGRGHYQAGFHQTATAGAFGAALAAGHLLQFDDAQMEQATGLVTTRASGLKSQFGTMGKPFNAGMAASNGVEAAQLVARGFVSNPEALAGINGFLATHHADGATDQPTAPYMTSVSHKFHACCHGLHATLEALASLPRPDPTRIAAITITTHPRWLTVCDIPAPTTGLQLKFSYRAIAAAALLGHSTARLDTYTDALCADPALVALRDRVTVLADDTLSETEALVRLETPDGDLEAHHDLDAPLSIETRATKLLTKCEALIGSSRSRHLWEAIEMSSLHQIIDLM